MGIIDKSIAFLFGGNGFSFDELSRMTRRNRFSKYLPYKSYDPETKQYHNIDDTIGYMFECIPLVAASPEVFESLTGYLNQQFPDNTVLSFALYADPYINHILDQYRRIKTRGSASTQSAVRNQAEFLTRGTKGLKKLNSIPVRNFRLFVSLKIPRSREQINYADYQNSLREVLKGNNLMPRDVTPEVLINWLAKLFNDDVPDHIPYDDHVAINRQVILADTRINTRWDRIFIGNKISKCMTINKAPKYINDLTFNYLVGDISGVLGDNNQITTPFLLTTNIIFRELSARLHTKADLVLNQESGFGSRATEHKRKQEEFRWASDEDSKGNRFLREQTILWYYTHDEAAFKEAAARIKRVWQSRRFVLQEDKGILTILFLSALPFGLYTAKKNVEEIDRDFPVQSECAARCLPIQSDFAGGGDAHIILAGRKGQLVTLDLFMKTAESYNAFICAPQGMGKSFLSNFIAFNYHCADVIIRIVDLGWSYKKLCNIVGGQYVSFSKDSRIRLNPFTHIHDFDDAKEALKAGIARMCFSSTGQMPLEEENTLIGEAVRLAWEAEGNDAGIDLVYDYLRRSSTAMTALSDLESERDGNRCVADINTLASKLAWNLRKFTSQGTYGEWFKGKSNLDLDSSTFCVLELEELKRNRELFNVVTLMLINHISDKMYLGKQRDVKMINIFDEMWQFAKAQMGMTGGANLLGTAISEGVRKARKYHGSFINITQSILDLLMFGDLGQEILSNSLNRLLLPSKDYEKAHELKMINYPPFIMDMLTSIRSGKPKYSEIFIDSPCGMGVGRLVVDPYLYYVCTSDPTENAAMEKMVQEGMTWDQALNEMVGRSGS